MAEDLSPWFGFRDDLDLDGFWWHRLAKVSYGIVLALAILLGGFLIFDGDGPELKAKDDYIHITGNLNDVLMTADPSVPNVIPAFLLLPGKVGTINENEEMVDELYLDDYYLNKSICTPDAFAHAGLVATVLNARDYTRTNSAETVTASLRNAKGEYVKDRRYCWFDTSLSSRSISDFVMYEFTTIGHLRAYGDYFFWIGIWSFAAHLVLFNLYYRGFIYVICGPRGKVKERYLRKPPKAPARRPQPMIWMTWMMNRSEALLLPSI